MPNDHLQSDDFVSRVGFFRYPLAAQTQLPTGIRALGYRHGHRPSDGRHRNSCPEHRLCEADRQFEQNIVSVTAEQRMWRDMHLDQSIAGLATAKA